MPIYSIDAPIVAYGNAQAKVEADSMEEALRLAHELDMEDWTLDTEFGIDVDSAEIQEVRND